MASGVRRIEAVAGTAAVEAVARQERVLREIGDILKIAPAEAPQRLRKLLDEQRTLEKQLAGAGGQGWRARRPTTWSPAPVRSTAWRWWPAASTGSTPTACARWPTGCATGSAPASCCVGSVVDGKVNLVAAVTKDLTKRFQAGKLVQEVARAVGGSGGGRPDLAQAGGKDPAKLDAALEASTPPWPAPAPSAAPGLRRAGPRGRSDKRCPA